MVMKARNEELQRWSGQRRQSSRWGIVIRRGVGSYNWKMATTYLKDVGNIFGGIFDTRKTKGIYRM
jgi:hypothetical protein